MVNWFSAWWQVRQSWSYLRHAYRCGWSLHDDIVDAWSHRRYAMAYAVAQAAPRSRIRFVGS